MDERLNFGCVEDCIADDRVGEGSKFFNLLLVSLEAEFTGFDILQESPESTTESNELGSGAYYTKNFCHGKDCSQLDWLDPARKSLPLIRMHVNVTRNLQGPIGSNFFPPCISVRVSSLLDKESAPLGLFRKWRIQII